MFDTCWYTFFPPTVAEFKRIGERLRHIVQLELSETRALDVTALVFGYSSYPNLVEYLAFDWRYPVKWDDEIDNATKSDRLRFQTTSLAKCLKVTSKEARKILDQWKPSSRTDSASAYGVQARMDEAKSELVRLGHGLNSDYMRRLSETFHPYRVDASEPAFQNTDQEPNPSPSTELQSRLSVPSISKLFMPVQELKHRARELRKLIQRDEFCYGQALQLVSKLCGFDAYERLLIETRSPSWSESSLLWDENLSDDELAIRRAIQNELLTNVLSLEDDELHSLLQVWRPTAKPAPLRKSQDNVSADGASDTCCEVLDIDTSAPASPVSTTLHRSRPIITIKRHRQMVPAE
ncbi:hypothetical protein [Paraburkholderia bannensis]|uniref:hypothetical protein n=1 Tax=Paraburkholderia bannensis TaxID=765414 RepID=UPI002AC36C99|nr:hypothetical protein [Paraburkholderia bannensis]